MRRSLIHSALAGALGLGLVSGCHHCCHRRPCCDGAPGAPGAPAPGGQFLPPVPPAPVGAATQQPAAVPPAPAPVNPPPGTNVFSPPAAFAPGESPGATSAWEPSPQVEVRLGAPQTGGADGPSGAPSAPGPLRLRPPVVTEEITPARQPPPEPPKSAAPKERA